MRKTSRRALAVSLSAGAFFGLSLGTAVAYTYVSYTPGAVGSGHYWGDNVRHTYNYSYASLDRAGCAGASNTGGGIFGSTGSPRPIFQIANCTTGSGTTSGAMSLGSPYYGAVKNQASSTNHFGSSYSRY